MNSDDMKVWLGFLALLVFFSPLVLFLIAICMGRFDVANIGLTSFSIVLLTMHLISKNG